MVLSPYSPSIPQEIIENIIDSCSNNRPALLCCALVSKQWLPRSRQHLFYKIRIFGYPEVVEKRLRQLNSLPLHLMDIVRDFEYLLPRASSMDSDTNSQTLELLESVLGKIVGNLRRLSLGGLDLTKFRPGWLPSLLANCSHLEGFVLSEVEIDSVSQLLTARNEFVKVKSLELLHIHEKDVLDDQDTRLLSCVHSVSPPDSNRGDPSYIEDLSIGFVAKAVISSLFHAHDAPYSFSHLEKLRLYRGDSRDSGWDLLWKCRETLTYLDFPLDQCEFISSFYAVKSSLALLNSNIEWIHADYQLLSKSATSCFPSLTHLSIDMGPLCTLDTVSTQLAQLMPSRFPALRRTIFWIHPSKITPELLSAFSSQDDKSLGFLCERLSGLKKITVMITLQSHMIERNSTFKNLVCVPGSGKTTEGLLEVLTSLDRWPAGPEHFSS
ncbi:hypothetical protein VKT23_009539 [Stygiomarasmius scandens]|uniref:F-box domain-containing protein n=1 Tax=Marasmiellus scandens TaxID=2682957 RepID=A0ABR1JE26_9AGAR